MFDRLTNCSSFLQPTALALVNDRAKDRAAAAADPAVADDHLSTAGRPSDKSVTLQRRCFNVALLMGGITTIPSL